jgi:hypothetical protein
VQGGTTIGDALEAARLARGELVDAPQAFNNGRGHLKGSSGRRLAEVLSPGPPKPRPLRS